MSPREAQCHIETAEVARWHLYALPQQNRRRADMLVGAASVARRLVELCRAQRDLLTRVEKHEARLLALHAADPQLTKRAVVADPDPLFIAVGGLIPMTNATDAERRAATRLLHEWDVKQHRVWQDLGLPDLVFDWRTWVKEILGDPPLVADAAEPFARPGGAPAYETSPITMLVMRAVDATVRRPLDTRVMVPAFLTASARTLHLKPPTPTELVLLEVVTGLDEPCGRASHGGGCVREYQARRSKWEKRQKHLEVKQLTTILAPARQSLSARRKHTEKHSSRAASVPYGTTSPRKPRRS